MPAKKSKEDSFEDLNAGGDFEASDSNFAISSDDEGTASSDSGESNKPNILPSIINIDGKQYVKINNKLYLLQPATDLKPEKDKS